MSEVKLAWLTAKLVIGMAIVVAVGWSYGSRPLVVAVAACIPVVVLLSARLALRGRDAKVPSFLRGGLRRPMKQLVQRVAAAIHGARRRGRVRWVELAALEAAEDDRVFSPDSVRTSAEALFRLVHLAWDARDRGRLATLLGTELLAEWERGLPEDEHGGRVKRLEVVGDVGVEYVGFTTRGRRRSARVVVLIEAVVRTYVEGHRGTRGEGDTRRLSQYWTLGLGDSVWRVVAIEERSEGKYHLDEAIGASLPAPL